MSSDLILLCCFFVSLGKSCISLEIFAKLTTMGSNSSIAQAVVAQVLAGSDVLRYFGSSEENLLSSDGRHVRLERSGHGNSGLFNTINIQRYMEYGHEAVPKCWRNLGDGSHLTSYYIWNCFDLNDYTGTSA